MDRRLLPEARRADLYPYLLCRGDVVNVEEVHASEDVGDQLAAGSSLRGGRVQEVLMPGQLVTAALAIMMLLVGLTIVPGRSSVAAPRWREAADRPPDEGQWNTLGDVLLLALFVFVLAVVAIATAHRAWHTP